MARMQDFTPKLITVGVAIIGIWFLLGQIGLLDAITDAIGITAIPAIATLTAFYAVGSLLILGLGLKMLNSMPSNAQQWLAFGFVAAVAVAIFYFAPDLAGGGELQFAWASVLAP